MKELRRHVRLLSLLLVAAAVAAGCEDDPVAPGAADDVPVLGKKPAPPGYVQMALEPEPGQVVGTAYDINDAHQVVGSIEFTDWNGSAFFWSPDEGGLSPQVLPNLSGTAASAAFDINERGEVAGTSGDQLHQEYVYGAVPVIWQPGAGGWTPRPLEAPGQARGINDQGEAVGFRPMADAPWNEEPVHWNAALEATVLPIPSGFEKARANRINNDGDIGGRATTPGGVEWAVLWVRTGPASWSPTVLDGGNVLGLTDRRSDGTLQAAGHALTARSECCQSVRWTVTVGSSGVVQSVRAYLGTDLFKYGQGQAINAAGDVAGFGVQGNNWAGTPVPALFPAAGSTTKLPISRGSSGAVRGISSDRWLTGLVDGQAVVWRP